MMIKKLRSYLPPLSKWRREGWVSKGLEVYINELVGKTTSIVFKSKNTLQLRHNSGLCSCMTVALSQLYGSTYKKVSSRFGLTLYKRYLFSNNWPVLFHTPEITNVFNSKLTLSEKEIINLWSADYLELPFAELSPYVKTFFSPSDEVMNKSRDIIDRYHILTKFTIGLHFRGSDAFVDKTRVHTASYNDYILAVKQLLSKNNNFKVLVQTDDKEAQDIFLEQFNTSAIIIKDLVPSTKAFIGSHFLPKDNPESDAVAYLAILQILSQCNYLVTHKGNGGLWEVLYRGGSHNVIQI
jgi:hypothetical protein